MADEKAIAPSEGRSVASAALESAAAADSHKRKLNNAPEPPAESDPNSNTDAVNNGSQEEENGGADESEAKRPRLESNGENVSEADCPENGHQVEENEDGPKEEEYEQPKSSDANVEEEKKDESKEAVFEQPKSVDADVKPVEDQEHTEEPLEAVSPEPASNETRKLRLATRLSRDSRKQKPRNLLTFLERGMFQFSESQPGLGRQILSRNMVVPNDKVN